jgi:hypothetical protein
VTRALKSACRWVDLDRERRSPWRPRGAGATCSAGPGASYEAFGAAQLVARDAGPAGGRSREDRAPRRPGETPSRRRDDGLTRGPARPSDLAERELGETTTSHRSALAPAAAAAAPARAFSPCSGYSSDRPAPPAVPEVQPRCRTYTADQRQPPTRLPPAGVGVEEHLGQGGTGREAVPRSRCAEPRPRPGGSAGERSRQSASTPGPGSGSRRPHTQDDARSRARLRMGGAAGRAEDACAVGRPPTRRSGGRRGGRPCGGAAAVSGRRGRVARRSSDGVAAGAWRGGRESLRVERRERPPPQLLELADGQEQPSVERHVEGAEPVRRAAEGAERLARARSSSAAVRAGCSGPAVSTRAEASGRRDETHREPRRLAGAALEARGERDGPRDVAPSTGRARTRRPPEADSLKTPVLDAGSLGDAQA